MLNLLDASVWQWWWAKIMLLWFVKLSFQIPSKAFRNCQRTLAFVFIQFVSPEHIAVEAWLLCECSKRRKLRHDLTFQVMEFLYANNMAFHYPEPADKNRYIRSKVWTYEYESFMPDVYDWPESKVHWCIRRSHSSGSIFYSAGIPFSDQFKSLSLSPVIYFCSFCCLFFPSALFYTWCRFLPTLPSTW